MYRHRFLALLQHSSQLWKTAACRQNTLKKVGAGSILGVLFYTAAAKSAPDKLHKDEPTWDNFYKNTALRRRFLSHASLSYNDEPFMTGEDFVKAVSSMERVSDKSVTIGLTTTLTDEEYQDILKNATLVDLDMEDFLKRPDYIISYSEFLFLLSVLVKPIDQFYRHFRILDRGNTNTLSKEEFLSIESLTSGGQNPLLNTTTTMQIFMFGTDQKQEIDFERFSKFLHGIQRQCLKAEFEVYSDGLEFITDDEFVRLLLRRTSIPDIKKARYIDRLEHRPEHKRNRIFFGQFCQFMNLLNDFPDFEVAIRMFAITKKPLTKKDFQRAVRASTGTEFDHELVDVIFDVFDEDNDNKLGYDEFIKVMNDSIKSRNALTSNSLNIANPTIWETYMNCVRQEMYKSYAN